MTEARRTHEVRPVTNVRTLRTAAAAGVTDLRTDGPGRYFVILGGANCMVIRENGRWHLYSPITMGYLTETLGAALIKAAQLVAEEADILNRAIACTDSELDAVARDTAHPEYHFRQCCIAERVRRGAIKASA